MRQCQELLLPGRLLIIMVKEKLQDYLVGMKECVHILLYMRYMYPHTAIYAWIILQRTISIRTKCVLSPTKAGKVKLRRSPAVDK
jgi:hypothetical protein